MTNYAMTQYDDFDSLEAAVEAVDNTVSIKVVPLINNTERKHGLIVGGTVGFDGGAI